jgi:hypothetical protein
VLFFLAQKALRSFCDDGTFERMLHLDIRTFSLLEKRFTLIYKRSQMKLSVGYVIIRKEPTLSSKRPNAQVIST